MLISVVRELAAEKEETALGSQGEMGGPAGAALTRPHHETLSGQV